MNPAQFLAANMGLCFPSVQANPAHAPLQGIVAMVQAALGDRNQRDVLLRFFGLSPPVDVQRTKVIRMIGNVFRTYE
jgi:hypothetical protein